LYSWKTPCDAETYKMKTFTIGSVLTRLEMLTLWSTLKFQGCSLCHITSNDLSGAAKGITNASLESKATVVFRVIVATI
jgi:hypothetical protein